MFDSETVAFLESGCALVVASVDASGEPWATRAWGLNVVADTGDEAEIRLLLDADDDRTLASLSAGGAIAVTGADVRTNHSTQCKGRALTVEPATDADRERAGRFCDEFIQSIHEVDGTPTELLARMIPRRYAACIVSVGALFNQTPGPAAGASLEAGAP